VDLEETTRCLVIHECEQVVAESGALVGLPFLKALVQPERRAIARPSDRDIVQLAEQITRIYIEGRPYFWLLLVFGERENEAVARALIRVRRLLQHLISVEPEHLTSLGLHNHQHELVSISERVASLVESLKVESIRVCVIHQLWVSNGCVFWQQLP